MTRVFHAWFSQRAKELFGSCIYLSPTEEYVEVTAISDRFDYGEEEYIWEDKVYVGSVSKLVTPLTSNI